MNQSFSEADLKVGVRGGSQRFCSSQAQNMPPLNSRSGEGHWAACAGPQGGCNWGVPGCTGTHQDTHTCTQHRQAGSRIQLMRVESWAAVGKQLAVLLAPLCTYKACTARKEGGKGQVCG